MTSIARKVLLGAATLACIALHGSPSNACPPRVVVVELPRLPAMQLPPLRLPPLPTALPPLPTTLPPWAPPQPPPPNDRWPQAWSRMEDEVLALTNARRAQGAVCGDKAFAPAPPLTAIASLRAAAREHSNDMGVRNYFDHGSPDGRSASARMKAAGFGGGTTGENIFAGPKTAAEVVDGWMKSPGHCANMMSPHYTALGVGYAYVARSTYGNYWTQDFGG